VFGGSGFYAFLQDASTVDVQTPYGTPSAPVTVGAVGDRRVAFLPRHGPRHELPPHMVPYRANVWAMRSLGVERLFAPCASGSLQRDIVAGDFVVCDQIVDRTTGRASTFFDGPRTVHVEFADPYCPQMRSVIAAEGRAAGIRVHDRGTVVVVQGPRFSTRAESAHHAAQGWHVVNMTQMPEAALAREVGMCYAAIALITDHDVGVEGTLGSVTQEEVMRVFAANNERLRDLLFRAIEALPSERACSCAAKGPQPGGGI
jgi:5'-methylthioadenosine phosphorylase